MLLEQILIGEYQIGKKIICKMECNNCHKHFDIDGYRIKHGRGLYCSVKCAAIFNSKKGNKNPNWKGGFPKCKICGKSLSRYEAKKCSICRATTTPSNLQPNWRGGISRNSEYVMVLGVGGKYFREHRLIVEKIINRKLRKSEIVHHINEKKKDNRPINLYLFKNRSLHVKYHNKFKKDNIYLKSNLSKRHK